MCKMYVKDEKGKYRIVDRNQKSVTKLSSSTAKLSLEELDARLRKVERIVIDPRK